MLSWLNLTVSVVAQFVHVYDSLFSLNLKGKTLMQNLEQYKDELELLLSKGSNLGIIIEYNYTGKAIEAELKNIWGDDFKRKISELPNFKYEYESWYSEAKSLVRQLLPDRLDDFIAHYEKPKARKALTSESYRISDLLTGLSVTAGEYPKKVIVGEYAAIPHFNQQLAIVNAVKRRFESSLFDIKQIVQADVLDSELDAAKLARGAWFSQSRWCNCRGGNGKTPLTGLRKSWN